MPVYKWEQEVTKGDLAAGYLVRPIPPDKSGLWKLVSSVVYPSHPYNPMVVWYWQRKVKVEPPADWP